MNSRKTHFITVYAVVINKNGSLLIVKRAAHDTMPGLWEMPGGGLNFAEEPKDGVNREVQEECGINVEVLFPVSARAGVLSSNPNEHIVRIAYLCSYAGSLDSVVLSNEHSDYQWEEFSKLRDYTLSSFLVDILEDENAMKIITANLSY